ncbi:aldehyde dehydrogenase [Vogesella oryzae]|uniref:aldehyde dehydrogenase n=1 Tax=Vogesella oryzae TaxID=1735285 RepID=UPI0015824344|nr:aldehyde dehydrogenase [Vogesella oryzae]
MFESSLLINGQHQPAHQHATFQRLNPVNGSVASIASAASAADVDAALAAASAAFPAWAATLPGQRRALLLKAADIMERRAGDFVARGIAEAGSIAGWYHFNVMLAAGILREAAGMTTQIGGELIPSDIPGNMAMGVRRPCGVVVGIAPWNAPVILGTRAIAMPLACGNTVILKSSELCPALHGLIGEVLHEAGFPAGVVNVISNAPQDAASVVERLVAHPAVKRVNFTGSTKVGRIIAALGAKYLKPVLLELGGKNPLLVLDDADLDAAVEAAAFGAFFNQGQICMSTERIIVDERIADEFVARFTRKAQSLRAGNPADGNTPLGALADIHTVEHAYRLVEDAVAHGASLTTGPLHSDGCIMQPAVIDGVTAAMALYRDESFAPIVGIIRCRGDEDAIRLANDSEYGLSAAVFSRDISRAMQVAERIESGICHINGPTVHDEAQMPFGGVKASGYGRFGGKASVNEFTELRWITIQHTPRHYPI